MAKIYTMKDLREKYFEVHGYHASDKEIVEDFENGRMSDEFLVPTQEEWNKTMPHTSDPLNSKEWTRPTFEDEYIGERKHNTDGGKTDFYDISGCKDVDDLAEFLDLRGDEFNCLKALAGIALERKKGVSRHNGTSSKRDAKKLLHYSTRIEKRILEDYNE